MNGRSFALKCKDVNSDHVAVGLKVELNHNLNLNLELEFSRGGYHLLYPEIRVHKCVLNISSK